MEAGGTVGVTLRPNLTNRGGNGGKFEPIIKIFSAPVIGPPSGDNSSRVMGGSAEMLKQPSVLLVGGLIPRSIRAEDVEGTVEVRARNGEAGRDWDVVSW